MNKQEFKQALSLAMSDKPTSELLGIEEPAGYPNKCGLAANEAYTRLYVDSLMASLESMAGCALPEFDSSACFVTLSQVAVNIRYHARMLNGQWDNEELKQQAKYARKFNLITPSTEGITRDQAIIVVGDLATRFNLPIEVTSSDYLVPIPEIKYSD